MDTRIWLFIISVALSALFVGIAIPLVLRRIPPNRWYGLRVPATLTDERVWYEANVVAGWDFIRVGVVTFLAGLLFMLLPLPLWASVLLWAGVVEIAVLAAVFHSWRYANRLLREHASRARKEHTQ